MAAEAVSITFRLRDGYRIAGRSYTSAFNVILKVSTGDGRTGFGCAAPAEEVTGESDADCRAALDDRLLPLLRECDATLVEEVARRARVAAPRAPAARAAVEMALLDLRARRAGAPLARLLGLRRGRLPTSVTLGVAPPDESLVRARRYVADGFRILKVKVGEDWEQDVRLIRSLRSALGPAITIRADANCGYAEADALRFLRALPPG
ncbi:MAG: enolase C-terminal domain-like protein, partial [Candidatus Polarisedimenticolia bacterium]